MAGGFKEFEVEKIKGIVVEQGVKASELVKRMRHCGLQASELAKAVELIREMKRESATVFLTFTSNMVSSGLRELFAQLAREKFVDCIITGVGSIEEDLMKTKNDFLLGSFDADDVELHERGVNRIGNIFVPNAHYEWLERFLKPFFEKELEKQEALGRLLAPSELIHDLGLEISDENSFVHQATKNGIPVFCPAPTDGAFGLQVFFFKQDHPKFGIDVTADMKLLSQMVFNAKKTCGIILGGGVAKHHAIGVNIVRGGFDYAVYVSTGSEYDGSLSGARTREAVSWGKISEKAFAKNKTVFVEGDASIIFPLIMAGVKD